MTAVLRGWADLWLAYWNSRRRWRQTESLLGRDRRVFYRVDLNGSCRMQHSLFKDLHTNGKITNVSLGGIGVNASVEWPEGSRVRLTVDAWELVVDALVVYRMGGDARTQTPARYGLKFRRLKYGDILRLRRLLREHYAGPLTLQ